VKRKIYFRHFSQMWRCFLLGLLLVTAHPPACAASLTDIPGAVSDAAAQLVQYYDDHIGIHTPAIEQASQDEV
jgi:hypothetical protein